MILRAVWLLALCRGRDVKASWLINAMIQHDLYHGGEINHIRVLRQGNDRWAWELG